MVSIKQMALPLTVLSDWKLSITQQSSVHHSEDSGILSMVLEHSGCVLLNPSIPCLGLVPQRIAVLHPKSNQGPRLVLSSLEVS